MKIDFSNPKIESGFCKSMLFGESNLLEENGVLNKELEIFYMIRKSTQKTDSYLMFFNGGPGVGFTDAFLEMIENPNFFPNINVICMDQRGTGKSSKPSDNLKELKYFTSRYIVYDAEQIRKQVIGENKKWLIFGESYGGHIVRKYLELYPDSIKNAYSFGYGKTDPVDMKVNIHRQVSKQLNEYFTKYPEDKIIIETLKSKLKETDSFSSETIKVSGIYLADFLIFWFGLKEEEQIHQSLNKFNNDNIVEIFKEEVAPLVNLLLKATSGKLNPVIAYIDLLDGLSDEKLNEFLDKKLESIGYHQEDEILSTNRLTNHFEVLKEDPTDATFKELQDEGFFEPDFIDNEKIINNINYHNIEFHVYGAINDVYTPVQIIKDEETIINQISQNHSIIYHYIEGGHHAWLHNNESLFHFIR